VVRTKHLKQIEKRLKDTKFMRKLEIECEQYVKANPEEFQIKGQHQRIKYDLEENKMVEQKQSKKKGGMDH
jgi:hypothetical protein